MKKHETPSEKAACYLAEGYNCAQNVLLGVYESWHDKNELVPKVATAFGSGIGQCCSVCGAVMVIGIKYGTNDSVAKKRTKAYDLAHDFLHEFELRHENVLCCELIRYDLLLLDPSLRKLESTDSSIKNVRF
jgi:C_GCAxxG_C_C family probable redox protein